MREAAPLGEGEPEAPALPLATEALALPDAPPEPLPAPDAVGLGEALTVLGKEVAMGEPEPVTVTEALSVELALRHTVAVSDSVCVGEAEKLADTEPLPLAAADAEGAPEAEPPALPEAPGEAQGVAEGEALRHSVALPLTEALGHGEAEMVAGKLVAAALRVTEIEGVVVSEGEGVALRLRVPLAVALALALRHCVGVGETEPLAHVDAEKVAGKLVAAGLVVPERVTDSVAEGDSVALRLRVSLVVALPLPLAHSEGEGVAELLAQPDAEKVAGKLVAIALLVTVRVMECVAEGESVALLQREMLLVALVLGEAPGEPDGERV